VKVQELQDGDIVPINLAFPLSLLVRYGLTFLKYNFLPYKKSLVFLTVIYVSALSFFRVISDNYSYSEECGIEVNFAFAFLSPPGLVTKAAKADYGEIGEC